MEKAGGGVALVVARYTEDLRWLGNIPPSLRVTVYNKGEEPLTLPGALPGGTPLPMEPLPNVGREAHTYLHHLAQVYADLPEYTLFCQGKPFDHASDFHQSLRTLVKQDILPPFLWLGHIVDTDDNQGLRLYVPWSKNPTGKRLDMDGFHQALLGEAGPSTYTFYLGAQFLVSRHLVWARPRDFWLRAAELAANFPDAAHCLERMWDRVFGVQGVPQEWQGGTLYLKAVKRLQG